MLIGGNMKFSVLIPVYNVEKFIEECLESVLGQTYDDFEVILVDDGSTDRSGDICDRYAAKDSRIKVIHKENQGLISSRRVGIEHAQGEYCVFVDSDDAVKPELLYTLDDYIEKYNADIVLYSFRYYDGQNTKPRNKELFSDGYIFESNNKKELYEKFISGPDYYAIWTKCIKTEILIADPIDYKKYYAFNMSEDVLQSIYPITKAERIVFADKELYLYRFNPQSVSHSMKADSISKKITSHVFSVIKEYLSLWGLDDEEHIKRLDAAQFGYAMYTFSQYYKAVPKRERRKIVDFEWDSFLPEQFEPNEYCGKAHRYFYKNIKEKNYFKLSCFFLKEKMYKKYKNVRAKMK